MIDRENIFQEKNERIMRGVAAWSPWMWRLLSALPTATSSGAMLLIVSMYTRTTRSSPHLMRMKFPPISFLEMNEGRELSLYGFPTVSALFIACAVPFQSYMMANVALIDLRQAKRVFWSAFAAFTGLAVHGIVPLQHDIFDIALGESAAPLSLGSKVHQGAALVFFAGSLCHCVDMVNLLLNSSTLRIGWKSGSLFSRASIILKCITICLCALPALLSAVLHPASSSGRKSSLSQTDFAGLAQWWTVACLILFYSTYSLEFFAIARIVGLEKKPGKLGKDE